MDLGQICQPISPKSSLPNPPFFGTKYTVANIKVGEYLLGGFTRRISSLPRSVSKPFGQHYFSKICSALTNPPWQSQPPPLSLSLYCDFYLSYVSLSLSLSGFLTHSLKLSLCAHTHTLSLLKSFSLSDTRSLSLNFQQTQTITYPLSHHTSSHNYIIHSELPLSTQHLI